MLTVEMLSEDEQATAAPSWSAIAEAIDRVSKGHSKGLLLEGPGDAWLAMSFVEGHGVQVMAIEAGEQAELVLTQPGARLQLLPVVVGGVPLEEAASTLVPSALGREAVRFFAETGKRSAGLSWQDPFEVERMAVGVR